MLFLFLVSLSRFLHGHATVDSEDLPGDVAGVWAGEEKGGVGDVFDLPEVCEGDFADDASFEVV